MFILLNISLRLNNRQRVRAEKSFVYYWVSDGDSEYVVINLTICSFVMKIIILNTTILTKTFEHLWFLNHSWDENDRYCFKLKCVLGRDYTEVIEEATFKEKWRIHCVFSRQSYAKEYDKINRSCEKICFFSQCKTAT